MSIKSVALILMFLTVGVVEAAAQATTPTPQINQIGYVRPDAATRRSRYLKSTFGLEGLITVVAGAGLSTATNSPEEWGPHWEGFGKRVASNFGKQLISNSVRYGLEEAYRLDSHYYRSQKRDVASRLRNALISPVTARNVDGKRVFGFPRIAGTYSSHIIAAEAWYPSRYGLKDGIKSGTLSLGTAAAFNLVKEFILKK